MRTPDADLKFETVEGFLAARVGLPPGPLAILLCESAVHAASSVRRLADLGASMVITLGETGPMPTTACPVLRIREMPDRNVAASQVNQLIDGLAGRWLLWQWNAEYFFFPFCETRKLADLTAFLSDERRRGLYTYALDLYAPDMPAPDSDPTGLELWFDSSGYHAFPDANQDLTVYGGLGWRFQEITPNDMAQIGRTSLFRAERGIHLDPNLTFLEPDYRAVSCQWHHNPTGALMTLRRARRVLAHPEFPPLRDRLLWQGSTRFDWHSGQLLELGMIEPGQWF
ncbi:MAG: hypothetical protein AAF409_15570 [Pseudomonadota bacterium]